MTNDELLSAWAAREWMKQAGNNTPLAKSIRRGKAQAQALKREHRAMRRSLAAEHGVKMRSLRKQQAENAEAMRKRREASDREFEQRRWDLLVGKR